LNRRNKIALKKFGIKDLSEIKEQRELEKQLQKETRGTKKTPGTSKPTEEQDDRPFRECKVTNVYV